MRNYSQISEAVKSKDPLLGEEVFNLGSELETYESEAEDKQKGIHAILNALKDEIEEVEGIADHIDKNPNSLLHKRIDNMYALMDVAYVYNDK